MKIAIHSRAETFSDRWIDYCEENNIEYKLVNCYDTDIIQQLSDCDGLMWHWGHNDYKAVLFARQLTYSLEFAGKKVFPDSKTAWHYDDKVGQKYLLESIGAPLVSSYVFYDREQARQWARETSYPKVFKLRVGAGSANVQLVKNRYRAFRLINRAFGKGFPILDRKSIMLDRLHRYHKKKDCKNFKELLKGLYRLIIPKHYERMRANEKGYVYFQEFIPENDFDIRVFVIGNRSFALKRMVRKNDFRASGSGSFLFNKEEIPLECVRTAFIWAKKIEAQSIAFDFLYDRGNILFVEISYSFPWHETYHYPGYWDDGLNWHEEEVFPERFMIEDFVRQLQ
ncbi:MAG: ATP-grasp domain-containing protein [Bacteroidales bacterium]